MALVVVAVDGPAGSGKSSVSREVASRLNFGYLDTGAGYRALTLHGLNNPTLGTEDLLASFDYEISTEPDASWVKLNGLDVSSEIRGDAVAGRVSFYAGISAVREAQLADARKRILLCKKTGIVVEGRDITTVVCPDAKIRVLLTAAEEVRLQRRGLEKNEPAKNLAERDKSDSKVVNFMTPAEGVELIDTTNLNFDQSVRALMQLIETALE